MVDNSRRNFLKFTAIIALALFGFLVYQIIFIQPQVQPTELSLSNEYRVIRQLPQAIEIEHSSIARMGIVTIQGNFVVASQYQEIRNYYEQELPKHGWQFHNEKGLTTWGKDYGDKELQFKKGDYVLNLDYVANNPDYDFTYTIVLTWQ